MRVLLVEDEKKLSAAICRLLKKENYITDPVYNGIDGLDSGLTGTYDAIILDVMLPGMDGFTVLKKLRENDISSPVLMLTARGGLDDRVKGLESGADYYLPKPFETPELLACLKAITRRKNEKPNMDLSYGDTSLGSHDGKLYCSSTDKSVKLGAKEYQLMEIFLRNPSQIIPKETLNEKVWGYDSEAEYNNLEVYISFVRKKLTFVGSGLSIKVSRGLGYSLEENK